MNCDKRPLTLTLKDNGQKTKDSIVLRNLDFVTLGFKSASATHLTNAVEPPNSSLVIRHS
jgi:hypothetical protein